MSVRDLVNQLSWEQLQEVFDDHHLAEKQGGIGVCFLRNLTECLMEELNIRDCLFIIWMDRVVLECYRRVATEAMAAGFEIDDNETESVK